MPQIGTKGANLDLLIRQGATFGPNTVTLKNSQGMPINITGATIRGQIRKTATAGVSATVTAALTNASGGQFVWSISAAQTAALMADSNSETASASLYVWDMEIQYADGTIYPLVYGDVQVFREITKETP